MNGSPSHSMPSIEEISEDFVERLRQGENPSIQEYQTQFPQLAEEIAEIFPALEMLEQVDPNPTPTLALDESIPIELGEYYIIRQIGRGGMGIVFEAQHATMRRRVALKVLPKSTARKPHQLERFQREARAAGQLHHT
ncbi:MAG: hypothetical protein KDA84_16230, partial [Planctomycetaceae bacterium]|nr:hypothetical protein [Planctomycetaceae bacterium]